MGKELSILILEGVEEDAELAEQQLLKANLEFRMRRASGRDDFLEALRSDPPDLILSDYSMPTFDGRAALSLAREICPNTPFIFISGTIGDDRAIESLRNGATDYVLKDRISRLGPSVQRALREQEQRAETVRIEQQVRDQAALLDEARDAILVIDLEGVVQVWNRSAERLYGWTAAETIGTPVSGNIHAVASPELAEAGRSVIERGEWTGRLRQKTKFSMEVIVESRWTLVRGADGSPRSILVVNTDITERTQMENQFLRVQRMESIGTLAGGIAHDLNNVLAPIIMALDLLKRRLKDDDSLRILQALETSATRGVEMVRQVLTFARGAEGNRITVEPRHIIREMESIARQTFPKTMHVRTQIPDDLWNVSGDPTQLHQVMLNLCVNARDAMPNGGPLTIGAENLVIDES